MGTQYIAVENTLFTAAMVCYFAAMILFFLFCTEIPVNLLLDILFPDLFAFFCNLFLLFFMTTI